MVSRQSLIQALSTGGSAVGAISAGPFAKYGRLNCIIATTVLVIVGASLTLVPNFVAFCFGRLLYGLAAGCYVVFCPKYIEETSPVEVKGPLGALTQVCICFGILFPFTIGMLYDESANLAADDIDQFILVIFGIPILLGVLQLLLLLSIFRYDTPVLLHQKGDTERLTTLLSKIYQGTEVTARLKIIEDENKTSEVED
jgi:MFS family permease